MLSVAEPLDLEAISTTRRNGATRLGPDERKNLGIVALGGNEPISRLAEKNDVSRKFVYQQKDKADSALDEAFQLAPQDNDVLFQLPVTRAWLDQAVLALVLAAHAPYRGVQEVFRDLLDHEVSLGKIHDVVTNAVEKARVVNSQEDLSTIRTGAHDEIFQGDPILVGIDPLSTYCYLLAQEPSRDGTTWAVHLLDLAERGLALDYTVADAGKGLRAGQAEALPGTPCRGDVFHALRELTKTTTFLDNRAYGCIGAREKLERRMERAKKKAKGQSLSKRLALARKQELKAIELAADMTILAQWMREDVLALVGPDLDTRRELFDFLTGEMRAREDQALHRIRPLRVYLENQRDALLAFVEELDQRLDAVALEHRASLEDVRAVFEQRHFAPADPRRWQKDGELWKRLRSSYPTIRDAIDEIAQTTVRASSMAENYNSRLRSYFSLRRQVGPQYLDLLRFFLNHRRYPRSRVKSRVGRSPAEILKGEPLPHWLEQLGFTLLRRAS